MSLPFFGQQKDNRILLLASKLDSLGAKIPALYETIDFNVSDVELPVLLNTIAQKKKINISINSDLSIYRVTDNFSNVSVKDILLHLCSKHSLSINSVGNIISIRKYQEKEVKVKREIPVEYNKEKDLFSIDLKNDSLSVALRRITDVTGENMLFDVGSRDPKITAFIKNKPLEGAIDKIAFTNNLNVTKTKDGYFLFQTIDNPQGNGTDGSQNRNSRVYRDSGLSFKILDSINKIIEVDFDNIDVGEIIKEVGYQLNIDMYTDTALTGISKKSFKAKEINYDNLLTKILEGTKLRFKKEDNIYYFSTKDKESIKNYVTIPLIHRSIEIMSTPTSNRNNFDSFSGGNVGGNFGTIGAFGNQGNSINGNSSFVRGTRSQSFNTNRRRQINSGNQGAFNNYNNQTEALLSLIPKSLIKDLEVNIDTELNSFIVAGESQAVERFRTFVKKIDKPVPLIFIEVMILEVSKTSTVNTGVELGLGDAPVSDSGKLFPSSEVTLGAKTLNRIIGGFNGFGSLNVGRVVPNFYAKIQAMESNGNIKIRSQPKLSTLNGHEAVLSNGEREYYAVVRRDIIGTQNPQTTEIRNYVPIDADLSISIKPMVAGDNQITLRINVLQSSFNEGSRIDAEAPPGLNSREFTSIIRVKNQDVVILGGLEENLKNDSGSGVPFLARIPIIKWFFSKKTRIDSKKKLSVIIKPTIIN